MKKIITSSLIAVLSGAMNAHNYIPFHKTGQIEGVAGNPDHCGDQDPMKTSKYPNSDPAPASADGSSGKYHKGRKHNDVTKKHYHIKKVKKDKSKEIKERKESTTR